MELKQYIADFNFLVGRLNKAEKIPQEKLNKYSEKQYMKMVEEIQKILKDCSVIGNKIESILGRPLTDYECLNGINI